MKINYDYTVIGAGLAGMTAARLLADQGKRVLVIEKLQHIGGSIYDHKDESGVLVHKYGPHIFHTNHKEVFDFLSRFTEWNGYSHKVVAKLEKGEIPVPFNLTALEEVYGKEKAARITAKLKDEFGTDTVSVMKLRESSDSELSELGEYVYQNIFLYYTMKQWGKKPSEIDPKTTERVPVRLSRDDRYFTDVYQGLPTEGYTEMARRMLDSELITVKTGCENAIALKDGKIYICGEETSSKVVYTGELDRLMGYRFGKLPYRTLDFVFETHNVDSYQSAATVNYTVSEDFTRISEFKKMTLQKVDGVTTVMKEYPRQYEGKEGEIPYYPVANPESAALYAKYRKEAEKYGLILLGRLAEYKYYNMDAVVKRAMELLK